MVDHNIIKHKCNCLILINSTVRNSEHKVVGLLVKNELVWTRNKVTVVQFQVLVQQLPRGNEQKHENPPDSWSIDKDFHLGPYQYNQKSYPRSGEHSQCCQRQVNSHAISKTNAKYLSSIFSVFLPLLFHVFLNAFHGFSLYFCPCLWQSWVSTASMILIPIFVSW